MGFHIILSKYLFVSSCLLLDRPETNILNICFCSHVNLKTQFQHPISGEAMAVEIPMQRPL